MYKSLLDCKMRRLFMAYINARKVVIEQGFKEEIHWQEDVNFTDIDETQFLMEAAWVILSSGMKETVIRNKFNNISSAFYDWKSANTIIENSTECKKNALLIFNNPRKINAITEIAEIINRDSFLMIKNRIVQDGVDYIQTLPYMGPATSYHFAKNIGLDVVKPDRHLIRVTEIWGYKTPYEMCYDISQESGDRISVVDIVLWRFATLCKNYIPYFLSYSLAF